MKNFPFKILAFCLLFLAFGELKAQSGPGTTFYGVNLEPMCWNTGSVDSTIYVAWLSAAGSTKPIRLYYFNAAGAAVTVSTGTLSPGYCNGSGGGPCSVTGKWGVESITSNTTYATNTYNSIAIESVAGTVSVSVDGGSAVTLATGTVITVRADACDYVQSPVTVNVSGGSAIVSRFY